MRIKSEKLNNHAETLFRMFFLVQKFSGDLGTWADRPIRDFYNFLKKIPYEEDPKSAEIVTRPRYVLDGTIPAADCKKKVFALLHGVMKTGYPGGSRSFPKIRKKLSTMFLSKFLTVQTGKMLTLHFRNLTFTKTKIMLHTARYI